jgi:phosphohistidine phosphatase SixA
MMLLRVLAVLLAVLPGTARAGWEALGQPGAVALIRHALAPGTGDPAAFRLEDCATQRNLDEAGRAQARGIGAAIRAAGVPVSRVLTSQWCRCRETAVLLDVGPIEDLPALNSFFGDRAKGPARTAALRDYLAAQPEGPLVLVTHQVNITALTGIVPRAGEAVIVTVAPDGTVTVLGRAGP